MTCEDVADAILDGGPEAPPSAREHLAECRNCRELAAAHRGALSLRPLSLEVPAPIPLPAVRGRLLRRRAGAAAMGFAAVAALTLLALRVGAPRPVPEAPESEWAEALDVPQVPITRLSTEVEGYTRRDPTVVDRSYAVFGGLALWVAPPRSHALESPPLRKALYPLQPVEEVVR